MTLNNKEGASPYDLFIVGLSICILLALAVEAMLPISDGTKEILAVADLVACLIFLIDFIVRFARADNKLQFMKWGWIDLLSSIPVVDSLRWGRAVRLIRLLRILRAVRATRHIMSFVMSRRAESAVLAAAMLSLIAAVLAAILMLEFEREAPGSNIHTSGDAIWWAWTTLTTVGYGDRYPTTTEGRIVAAALMTVGVGLFGIWTAFVASWLLSAGKAPSRSS